MEKKSSFEWPAKTKEFQDHSSDSTIWNEFKYRDNDIIIATVPKAGTTWTQQIVAQLIFNGQTGLRNDVLSPWLEFRKYNRAKILSALEAQKHRRFIKTHLHSA